MHPGLKCAARWLLALSLQFAMSSAMAGDTCAGDLSQWPSELTYLPTMELHEGAVLQLGPKTIGGLVVEADYVTVAGQVISIVGWWEDACGFMHFPFYSIVDVPHLAPGVYTVNFNVVGFPGPDQFTKTLVVAGGGAQAPVPVPAVSGHSLAAGILGVLVLVGWTLRRDRPRRGA